MIALKIPGNGAILALLTLSACASTVGNKRTLETNSLSTYQIDLRPNSHGSGVVLANSADGAFVLTCSHVVNDEKNIRIRFINKEGKPDVCPGRIVVDDPGEDMAVIKFGCRFPQTVLLGRINSVHRSDKIYNIGYPYSLGEMYGEGYIQKEHFGGITLTQYGPRVVRDVILAQIPDGAGTSGSGIFDAGNGNLVGLMKSAYAQGEPPAGVTLRMIIPVGRIRSFLDKHKIPYETIDAK